MNLISGLSLALMTLTLAAPVMGAAQGTAQATITASQGLNFRAAPQGRVLTAIPRGTRVDVIARSGNWLKVRLDSGRQGYIWSNGGKNVSLQGSAPSAVRAGSKSQTQAVGCLDGSCQSGGKGNRLDMKASADDILQTLNQGAAPRSSKDLGCFQRELLKAAKTQVRVKYGNRPYSAGRCARGVRESMDRAGMNMGQGLGHAIDFHAKGRLAAKGFVNRISQYPNPKNAPAGAILVFSGPKSKQYLRNGRFAKPWGDYLGHVTIKGDDGKYYTDARTANAAVRNRYLVGVYVLEDPSRLPAAIRRKCP